MTEKWMELQRILDKATDGKKIFGTSFAIKKGEFIWSGVSGDLGIDRPYFIASTTKLFTTAIVVHLQAQGKINLNDTISNYLDRSVLNGLHVYKGKEYSSGITIRQLLAHTSGLPDYFQSKGANGKSLAEDLFAGHDQHWSFEQAIERTKEMQSLFVPDTKAKAHYSDANFQLLSRIIEHVTRKSYEENCKEIISQPLCLNHTYLYQDATDNTPHSLYYKAKRLHIPQAMTSFGSDGGMVSTSTDMLKFLEAFFTGSLFPVDCISSLQQWNRIFFPMRSGIGIHKFKLPWIFNPAGTIPDFIGHSGLSGALAFYSPKENLFIAGTVNQVAHPDLSFKIMIQLAQKVLKK